MWGRPEGAENVGAGEGGKEKKELRFHTTTVVLWLCLSVLIILTSVIALRFGVEALFLVVTGWIVAPFFLYWLVKKLVGAFRKGGGDD